jgi:magnesium-protoporphyrin IX monomethyl ester (oxidative) cyclase
MNASITIKEIQLVEDIALRTVSSLIIIPQFYTADHDHINKIKINPVRAELDIKMKEYEGDNKDHFQRDDQLFQKARHVLPKLTPKLKKKFLDYLVTSLKADFSG